MIDMTRTSQVRFCMYQCKTCLSYVLHTNLIVHLNKKPTINRVCL